MSHTRGQTADGGQLLRVDDLILSPPQLTVDLFHGVDVLFHFRPVLPEPGSHAAEGRKQLVHLILAVRENPSGGQRFLQVFIP
jgi:hypothetical protein